VKKEFIEILACPPYKGYLGLEIAEESDGEIAGAIGIENEK